MTAESAAQQGSEPAGAGTSALVPDSDGHDDIKRKFREALARKCGAQADSADAGHVRGSGVSTATR